MSPPSQFRQTQRCWHGNTTTVAANDQHLRQIPLPVDDLLSLLGSTHDDSSSDTAGLSISTTATTLSVAACRSCAWSDATSISSARASTCKEVISDLSLESLSSSSALCFAAVSNSAAFSCILLAADSSAADINAR